MNSVACYEIARDKMFQAQIMAANGVPIPATILAKLPMNYETVNKHFTYPIIVKGIYGNKGKYVWKCDNEQELKDLCVTWDPNNPLIIQEFLAASTGKDLRAFVCGGEILGTMLRVTDTGFKANIFQGGYGKSVVIKEKLADLIKKVAKLCHGDILGIDLLLDADSYKICEINAHPGFEGLEKATEINIPRKVLQYVKAEIQRSREIAAKEGSEPLKERMRKKTRVGRVSLQHHHVA